MPILEKKVKDISEYLSTITGFKSSHDKLWFRGHSDVEYSLQPTVYRAPYTWEAELPLLHQFKARAARFIENTPEKDIEWLFIMQHYATPTRLLDWSESALVALAFATQYRSLRQKEKDAAVWCLNPKMLNKNTMCSALSYEPIPNICDNEELVTMLGSPRQEYPVAIIGPQNTERIIAQKGVFTLFPAKDSFSLESLEKSDQFLIKIVIPASNVESISNDLYYIGVTESTVYPELESISKELRKNYEGGE